METGLIKLKLEGWKIVILFNILPLDKDKAVLGILFLRKFNLKIN